jgi:hypothetical protein
VHSFLRASSSARLVVDRQCDKSGFEASAAYGVGELGGVLPDDAHEHGWVAMYEIFDEPGKQEGDRGK